MKVSRGIWVVGALAGEMQAGDHIGAEAFGIGAEQQHLLRHRRQHLLADERQCWWWSR